MTWPEVASSRLRWRAQRRWLNQNRSRFAHLAAGLYPPEHRVPGTSFIAPPEWVADEPIELGSLNPTLSEQAHPVAVDGSEPATLPVRPLRTPTTHFERYTSAIKHLDPPRLFESRPSYRLLDASLTERRLSFGLAAYFDKLDVSEALGREAALAGPHDDMRGHLPFRDLLGDPFDPARRAIVPGITTLTVRLRRHPAEPSFLLHRRHAGEVATGGGVYSVVPAGEFQPSSVALWDRTNDFDLWRNIVREFSEELLGEPEHDGSRTRPVDYDDWALYRDLTDARRQGTASAFFLGIGMNALTLTTTMLTAVVIDDDVFEDVFGNAVHCNEEGEIVSIDGGSPVEGVPFTAPAVDRMLGTEPMAPSGAACLSLAWRHRDVLLS